MVRLQLTEWAWAAVTTDTTQVEPCMLNSINMVTSEYQHQGKGMSCQCQCCKHFQFAKSLDISVTHSAVLNVCDLVLALEVGYSRGSCFDWNFLGIWWGSDFAFSLCTAPTY